MIHTHNTTSFAHMMEHFWHFSVFF